LMAGRRNSTLARIRKLCLSLPETSERLSHGHPTFFIRGKKAFVMYLDDHHGDGRLAIWCAAPQGMQHMLCNGARVRSEATSEAEQYFVPPYVGHRGWLGVRLDKGLDWNEIAGAIEDAYATVAPEKLVQAAALAREEAASKLKK
jgi:hypothetical protein